MELLAYNERGAQIARWHAAVELTVGNARREILANGIIPGVTTGWTVPGVGMFTFNEETGTLRNPMQFACWHEHEDCVKLNCVACGIHFESGCPARVRPFQTTT